MNSVNNIVPLDTVVPKMVTVREAAAITGLAVNHIRNLCNAGEITAVRTGRKVIVNLNRLVDYLNAPPTPTTANQSAVRRIAE